MEHPELFGMKPSLCRKYRILPIARIDQETVLLITDREPGSVPVAVISMTVYETRFVIRAIAEHPEQEAAFHAFMNDDNRMRSSSREKEANSKGAAGNPQCPLTT